MQVNNYERLKLYIQLDRETNYLIFNCTILQFVSGSISRQKSIVLLQQCMMVQTGTEDIATADLID